MRSTWLYAALGIVLWLALFNSGLHATLTGVALAALTPARPELDQDGFELAAAELLESHREATAGGDSESEVVRRARRSTSLTADDFAARTDGARAPPVDKLLFVPVCALANAGVTFSSACSCMTRWAAW